MFDEIKKDLEKQFGDTAKEKRYEDAPTKIFNKLSLTANEPNSMLFDFKNEAKDTAETMFDVLIRNNSIEVQNAALAHLQTMLAEVREKAIKNYDSQIEHIAELRNKFDVLIRNNSIEVQNAALTHLQAMLAEVREKAIKNYDSQIEHITELRNKMIQHKDLMK